MYLSSFNTGWKYMVEVAVVICFQKSHSKNKFLWYLRVHYKFVIRSQKKYFSLDLGTFMYLSSFNTGWKYMVEIAIVICFQRFHSKKQNFKNQFYNHLTTYFCYAIFDNGCNQPLPVSCYHSVSKRPQRNTKKMLLFWKEEKPHLLRPWLRFEGP